VKDSELLMTLKALRAQIENLDSFSYTISYGLAIDNLLVACDRAIQLAKPLVEEDLKPCDS
jgi:hypothetical protein